MTQHDYAIADQPGASFLTDLNNALSAVVTHNSGATAPNPTFAFQHWPDTSANEYKIRNAANSAWVVLGTLDSVGWGLLSRAGGSLTGAVNAFKGADVAAATTTNVLGATGNYVDVTGTTSPSITSLGTSTQAGSDRAFRYVGTGTPTLVHNGSSLIIPGGQNITLRTGDIVLVRDLGGNNALIVLHQPNTSMDVVEKNFAAGNLIFTEFDDTRYSAYDFEFSNCYPSVSGASMIAHLSVDGGTVWRSTAGDYLWSLMSLNNTSESISAISSGVTGPTTSIKVFNNQSTTATSGGSGNLEIINGNSTRGTIKTARVNAAGDLNFDSGGFHFAQSLGIANAIRFQASSGVMTAGRVLMRRKRRA